MSVEEVVIIDTSELPVSFVEFLDSASSMVFSDLERYFGDPDKLLKTCKEHKKVTAKRINTIAEVLQKFNPIYE